MSVTTEDFGLSVPDPQFEGLKKVEVQCGYYRIKKYYISFTLTNLLIQLLENIGRQQSEIKFQKVTKIER